MAQTTKKKSALGDFVDFIREQGVVGLAVAVILGAAAKDVVDSLVNDVVDPLIGLVFNAEDLATKSFSVTLGDNTAQIVWGNLLSTIISLLIVALVVYFVLNKFFSKLDKKKN